MGCRTGIARRFCAASLLIAGAALFWLAVTAGTASVAHAQGAAAIVVEGNRRVEAETIRNYFRLGPGERIDAAKIDAAYKALYGTGLFEKVEIIPSGARVVVRVIENPVINRVAFEGNRRLKDEQILLEVQSKARGTFSRPLVQADVSRIIEIYHRSGRYNIRVEPKIIQQPNNRVDLIFEINEGDKTTVRKIVFVGNRSYSDQRLRNEVKSRQANILSFLQSNNVYDPDRVEGDRGLLRRFYLKNGFADVRIVSAVGEFVPDISGFIITFTIDEGPRYRFGKVEIQSRIAGVDAAVLRNRVFAYAGGIYNAEAIEKTVEDLTIEISRRGYPFAAVRPRGDRDFETKLVSVVFVIEDGPRVYVERINVRGNTRTRDYVIRREFDFAEGDAFNRALVDRGERRLKNLNYFKNVKITNEPGSAPDRVVINVDVEEQSTGEFAISGGYSTSDGFVGEVSVGERNLLGRG
ncbi:MAG: outer membrane protein assembly factor BamA, partial [Proteobacteria bacterium]|nr:outer membrane protein assembly factor BamA [Pseudomonadota bacterium]